VTIDGNPATVTGVAGQDINCTTPAGTVGAKTVAVNTGSLAVTLPNGFTYLGGPTLTGVTPNEGPESGGTSITLTGNNLLGTTQIWFGSSTILPPFTSINNTTIQCLSPARGANPLNTAIDVWLTTPGGDATDDLSFTYRPSIFDITSVNPINIKVAGNEAVEIIGTGFVVGQPVTVKIGGNTASSALVVSVTKITCNTPVGVPGFRAVEVVTGGGSDSSSDAFVYWAVPSIASIVPNEGPTAGNTSVTITGGGFKPIPTPGTNVSVKINSLSLINPAIVSDTQITGITPPNAIGPQDVVISTPGGDATADDAFTYQGQPQITSITPNEGPVAGNTAVTIVGTNFKSTGTTVATIGGNSLLNIVVSSDGTQITGNTPAGTVGPRDVRVATGGGSNTLSGGFTYWNVPTITGIIPSYGRANIANPVTIKGTGFTPTSGRAVTVDIGGAASSVVVVNSTTITCNTPTAGAGFVNVSVTTPGGTATLVNGFEFWGAPVVTEVRNLDINPDNLPGLNEGMLEGQSLVELVGQNFHPGANVVFRAGLDATSDATADITNVIVYSSTRIACLTPPSFTISGDASDDASSDVTVTNKDTQTGTKIDAYWYRPFGRTWQVGRGKFTPRSAHASVIYNNLMWVLGGQEPGPTNKNDVLYSSDGINWSYATIQADWSARYGHAAVPFFNQIFVIGGDNGSLTNDVYASSNGSQWDTITSSADWASRRGHSVVVYDNRLWLFGGDTTTGVSNDVWYSFDGQKWLPFTGVVPWSARAYHSCLVFGSNIWLMGGQDATGDAQNDIWSFNGTTWKLELANAPWAVRYAMTVVEFNGFMWLLGGTDGTNYLNDVWKSGIGTVWNQETTTNPLWTPRSGHTALSYNNKLFVIGGADNTRVNVNDVWSSPNGANWTKAENGWSGRAYAGTTHYQNQMWVLGGRDASGDNNDVWSSGDGSTWTLNNVAAAWSQRNSHVALSYKDASNDEHLVLIGGQSGDPSPGSGTPNNEVWDSTDDGTTWAMIATTPFTARSHHTALFFGDRLWVFGGFGGGASYLNDVWSSSDGGKTWTSVAVTTPFTVRAFHASVVYDNKMWVIGGFDGGGPTYLNDILSSIDGKVWTPLAAPPWSARAGHGAVRYDNRIWVIGGFDGATVLNDAWWYSPTLGWVDATAGSPGPLWPARADHGAVVFGSRLWILGGTTGTAFFEEAWKNQ
jgi:N-acetylneuraminic acid mutarotase